MKKKTYEAPKVCPHCGKRPFVTQAPMYPSGQNSKVYVCPSHGILFLWQLWGEAEWLAKRKPFLDTKAGQIDMLIPGDR